MTTKILKACFLTLLLSSFVLRMVAQDKRAQYPGFLTNSYFSVNVGYIQYPFTNAQLEHGFEAGSVYIPHVAADVVLFGHQFNKYLSAQVSYMRPVKYLEYRNVNGDQTSHHVWMHYGGLTLKAQVPVIKKFYVYGEAGLGVVSRHGFSVNNAVAVKSADYGTVALGAGLHYHLNNKWDLVAGTTFSPANSKINQPHMFLYSGGFRYTMRPLSEEQVRESCTSGYVFPVNMIQVGYSTNSFGYDVNKAVSKQVPIFWGGEVEVAKGIAVRYQRNVFHTRKVFSLYFGASASYWKSNKTNTDFYTFSVFPVFRFTLIHTKPVDYYFNYSVAGPSYISKIDIDGHQTGRHFTFQDFMGMGFYTGKKRNFNLEVNINHYSNGNMFTENAGVKIPLTFNLGYTF